MTNNTFLYTTITLLSISTIYNLFWFKKETEKLNALAEQYDKNIEQYNKNVQQHNRNVEQHNRNYKEFYTYLKNLHANAYKLTNDFKKTRDVIQQLCSKIGNSEEVIPEFSNDIEAINETFSIISCDIDKYDFATKSEMATLENPHWLYKIFS
jgi:chromosome segregation ATPase